MSLGKIIGMPNRRCAEPSGRRTLLPKCGSLLGPRRSAALQVVVRFWGATMTLEDLGNLGDFFGAIGVIATLIYLAVQIRQGSVQTAMNTKAIHATAFQNLIDHHANLQMQLMIHPVLRNATNKARSLSPESLSEDEIQLYGMFTTNQLRSFYNAFVLYSEGLIKEEQWKSFSPNLSRVASSRAFPEFWSRIKHGYPKKFQAVVDSKIQVGNETSEV